jgi:histidinol-phosphate phosphatase family protein|tara:strand:- start:1207 stop:1869 length:663 start_codon:yes stop_codon:yes gene_type:complete
MPNQILICIDRDGTINFDDNYHLGHQKNWKSKVKILDNVTKALKKLRKLPNTKIYLVTNQPGVAIKNFKLLTKKRAEEVCKYVLDRLENQGVKLDGYELCGKANPKYVKKKKEQKSKFIFDKKLVGNFNCIKPKPGMIYNILKKENLKKSNTIIYFIGDRASDVKTGVNAKGFGILVPFPNRKGEIEKTKKLKSKKKYIAKDFRDAVDFINKKENKLLSQ